LATLLVLTGCSQPSPPLPLPYASSAAERIAVVRVDHEVSRFWRCGWAGDCPHEIWRYCLAIEPLTDDAAVKWYGIYHDEHLERARAQLRGIARGDMHEAPVPPPATHAPDGRALTPLEAEEDAQRHAVLTRMERFRRDVQLYDRGDRRFREQIVEQMKAGFRMEAYYSVSGSGSERRTSGWHLTPGC
jgi:hypothetical protein